MLQRNEQGKKFRQYFISVEDAWNSPDKVMERALQIAALPGVVMTSFGDMLRVPGSSSDLFGARAKGADVRVVYSPMDAVKLAQANPEKQVVFFAVGFETTVPAIAASLLHADKLGLKIGTVKSRIFFTRQKLMQILSDYGR